MPEKFEEKFEEEKGGQELERNLEIDKKAEEMVEKGEAKTLQEAIEMMKKERFEKRWKGITSEIRKHNKQEAEKIKGYLKKERNEGRTEIHILGVKHQIEELLNQPDEKIIEVYDVDETYRVLPEFSLDEYENYCGGEIIFQETSRRRNLLSILKEGLLIPKELEHRGISFRSKWGIPDAVCLFEGTYKGSNYYSGYDSIVLINEKKLSQYGIKLKGHSGAPGEVRPVDCKTREYTSIPSDCIEGIVLGKDKPEENEIKKILEVNPDIKIYIDLDRD